MNIDEFIKEVNNLGIEVSDYELELLDRYYNLLVSYNENINLTAITDKKQVYLKHFYDSLTITKVINLNEVSSLCDIGTGAGFPGIVLKIFFPHLKLTLVDALNKRINFLNEVISELNLKEVKTLHIRAEEFSKDVREEYDVVTARAVSSFNILLEYSIPLVKRGKYFIAMRGLDDTNSSDNALNILKCEVIKKNSFKLPFEDSIRTVVLVQKKENTNKKYPRKFSEIKKHPL